MPARSLYDGSNAGYALDNVLLLEDGTFCLLEDNSFIFLEP